MTELHSGTLEWAAEWIEGSLKGEDSERVREFGRNMATTLRAAAPRAVREEAVDTQIEIGDRVRVECWQGKDDICGDVVYMPTQIGDSWIIRTADRLFYLQHFAVISKCQTTN